MQTVKDPDKYGVKTASITQDKIEAKGKKNQENQTNPKSTTASFKKKLK